MRFGFTTAQEGRSAPGMVKTLEQASRGGQLKIDVACYPDVSAADAVMHSSSLGRSYTKRFRIAGVKLNLDGSPQGKTAWPPRSNRRPRRSGRTAPARLHTYWPDLSPNYGTLWYTGELPTEFPPHGIQVSGLPSLVGRCMVNVWHA